MKNKLEKLRKLRSLAEDTSTTLFERELAHQKYVEYKNKYSLDDTEIKRDFVFIKVSDQHELKLLYAIVDSFNIEMYQLKKHSKLKVYFYATKSEYLAIKDEYDWHRSKLIHILEGTTIKYLHSQVIVPVENKNSNKKYNEEFLKAYHGNSWLDKERYKNKLKLEN